MISITGWPRHVNYQTLPEWNEVRNWISYRKDPKSVISNNESNDDVNDLQSTDIYLIETIIQK